MTENDLTEVIERELDAFPGVSVSMLHARMSVKYGTAWRERFQDMVEEGLIVEGSKIIDHRAVAVYYLPKDAPAASPAA